MTISLIDFWKKCKMMEVSSNSTDERMEQDELLKDLGKKWRLIQNNDKSYP